MQVSGNGDVGCVCRSASVGSRPGRRNTRKARSCLSKDHESRTKRQCVAKQDSSPHLTPSNSVSTLVCSEPDPELEGLHGSHQPTPGSFNSDSRDIDISNSRDLQDSEKLNYRELGALNYGDSEEQNCSENRPSPSPSSRNYQQQMRHQQFVRQHQQQQQHQTPQQYFSTDVTGSCV